MCLLKFCEWKIHWFLKSDWKPAHVSYQKYISYVIKCFYSIYSQHYFQFEIFPLHSFKMKNMNIALCWELGQMLQFAGLLKKIFLINKRTSLLCFCGFVQMLT